MNIKLISLHMDCENKYNDFTSLEKSLGFPGLILVCVMLATKFLSDQHQQLRVTDLQPHHPTSSCEQLIAIEVLSFPILLQKGMVT